MTQVIVMSNASHSTNRNQGGAAPAPGLRAHGEEAFAAVFDTSAEALVIVNTEGIIQRANPRAKQLLRLKESARRSLGLKDFLASPAGEQLASLWEPRPRPASAPSLEASLTTGFPVRITLRWILPGSQDLLLCVEDGGVVQRAEAKSRYLEAELRSLLDSIHSGVLLIDPSGKIRFSNARFGQLFGLSTREIEDTGSIEALEELLAERFHSQTQFGAPWAAYASGSGEPQHDELELTRPTRRVFERFSRPVLDAQGHPLGWLELYTDVTGERQIQSKMLQTEKMAALGQLVSGIAHELNNPLTAIMGYAQLLLGRGLEAGPLSETTKVYQEAERARRIVKNLLYFARETAPERTRVDVNEIVERTLALRSYELKMENIMITCELAPALPQTIADPYQLQQVVLNLLINAEQALLEGRGQGRVLIRTSHVIEGTGSRSSDRIVLEVSDDGPGVPPDIASRIFDPFFTTKQPGFGTGLGLSIVYGIVHQHNGEVAFENQPGGGARFTVELPVIPVPPGLRSPLLLQSSSASSAAPAGRILVVEDEPTVAQLVVDVLREEGHEAEAVLDSQEGLTRVSRASFDLVICDLRMPRLDGTAFYDVLVRTGSPLRDRIIFITGDTLAPRTLEFLERNNLPYLAKPFLVEEIKLAVNRALARAVKQGT
ncbi:MAG TPA: ATP-binding protein [Candidatus Baltobacteraceae bacterium]|nr:ATP-binding protein [Candidatus Baltobacteraceae bacterium]